jgi:hypothetical protein
VFEEPHLGVIKFPNSAEWRAEREHGRNQGRQRYRDRLIAALPLIESMVEIAGRADAIVDHLFAVARIDGDGDCICSCHPRLPESDLHDYGFGCPCRLTAEERAARFAGWQAGMDEYWESPEGRAQAAARQVEEDELISWLAANPDVVVTTHGGMAPEQWRASVEGHSFYFRERHGDWRIELDLRPSGRFYRAWVGGDLEDDANFELRQTEEGDVIAEGTTGVGGYGETPVERAGFIVEQIRVHLEQGRCDLHTAEREGLELLFGRRLRWCPACGLRL